MILVIQVYKTPNHKKLGVALVRYHDMVFHVDICLWEEKKLWVRMPEIWITPTKKRPLMKWPNKQISDAFQKEILNQIQSMTGLNLKKAIEIKRKAMQKYIELKKTKK